MEVTHEGSMAEYRRLLETPPKGPVVPFKPLRSDPYSSDGKPVVALVRSENRVEGILEAFRLIGGIQIICSGIEGEFIIKPNCNTDDPFPRNTHHETVKTIAESLIGAGVSPRQIVVGDMSGRFRGLPTRHTMDNMGLKKVAEDLGLQMGYFEEEDWVVVKPPKRGMWPDGIKIPRRIYEADRVILSPILRTHRNATFSMSLKLAVGLIEALGREWLHNGESFYEKMLELNLAYSADLIVADAMKFYLDGNTPFEKMVEPGIIMVGSNRVAVDAISVALMKYFGTHSLKDKFVTRQKQLVLADEMGIGKPCIQDINLKTSNIAGDEHFDRLITYIIDELV